MKIAIYTNNLEAVFENGQLFFSYCYQNFFNVVGLINLQLLFTFQIFTVFLIGLIFGSFANVCITRLPKDKTIIFGRSNCPKCKKKISWYDNIPLISFILLKGKCRQCNKKISINYFFVELIIGIFLLLFFYTPVIILILF